MRAQWVHFGLGSPALNRDASSLGLDLTASGALGEGSLQPRINARYCAAQPWARHDLKKFVYKKKLTSASLSMTCWGEKVV